MVAAPCRGSADVPSGGSGLVACAASCGCLGRRGTSALLPSTQLPSAVYQPPRSSLWRVPAASPACRCAACPVERRVAAAASGGSQRWPPPRARWVGGGVSPGRVGRLGGHKLAALLTCSNSEGAGGGVRWSLAAAAWGSMAAGRACHHACVVSQGGVGGGVGGGGGGGQSIPIVLPAQPRCARRALGTAAERLPCAAAAARGAAPLGGGGGGCPTAAVARPPRPPPRCGGCVSGRSGSGARVG